MQWYNSPSSSNPACCLSLVLSLCAHSYLFWSFWIFFWVETSMITIKENFPLRNENFQNNRVHAAHFLWIFVFYLALTLRSFFFVQCVIRFPTKRSFVFLFVNSRKCFNFWQRYAFSLRFTHLLLSLSFSRLFSFSCAWNISLCWFPYWLRAYF